MKPFLFLSILYFSGTASALQQVRNASPEPLGKVLSYPNCRITIFFEEPIIRVAGDVWLQKEKIDQATQVSICNTIEKVFDQMPQKFRSEFDGVDIYLVHTNKELMYNWHQNRDVYLDAYRIRPGLTDKGSYITSLLSEMGFMFADKYSDSPDMASLNSHFRNYRQRYRIDLKMMEQESTYYFGFVNKLSIAKYSSIYDPRMEFGEIFAHILCPETQGKLKDFIMNQPNADLSKKVDQLSYTIRRLFPELNHFPAGFELKSNEKPESGQSELLAAHELRSFQTNMARLATDDNEIESSYQNESTEFASLQNEFFPPIVENVDDDIYSPQVLITTDYDRITEGHSAISSTTVKKKQRKGGWILLGVILLSLALAGD